MGTMITETYVARPLEDVFAYLRDYSNQAVWQAPGVTEVVVEPPGPAQVGTRVHKVRRTPMGALRFTEEVTAMDEAECRWSEITRTSYLSGSTVTWQVLAEQDGCRVRREGDMRANGLMRLLLPMIKRSASKGFQAEFAQLKRVLESAPLA